MSDESTKSAQTTSVAKSLWVVTAATQLEPVKARTGRSVKDAIAAAAEVLRNRYRNQQGFHEARASRLGK